MKSQQQVITEGAAAAAASATHDRPLATTPSNQKVTFLSSAAAAAERGQVPIFEENKQSMVVEGAPDIGILSKNFFKNKGREPSVVKQFAIHRKKQAAVDVDVGILSNGRRRQTNLHEENRVTGRSLQSEEEFPLMCPSKSGRPGWHYFDSLFYSGYFPKCSCPSPTTCGPVLCECLELNADGDILQCMDSLNQLCRGTKYIEWIPGPWSIELCLGSKWNSKSRALNYCSYLPCFVDGGSWWQCRCNRYDSQCTQYTDARSCTKSECCQAQTDDEGREECIDGNLWESYYDEYNTTLFSISDEQAVLHLNECFSDGDKSIVQCYCESFSYPLCVNDGVAHPNLCEAMNCCFEQTEDDARLDCFSRFRNWNTGFDFYRTGRDTIQESCIASGKSSDQCKCDIQGLSNCVKGIWNGTQWEPRCDLFQCCQSQTVEEGVRDCLVQEEARLVQYEAQWRYGNCIYFGDTTESCYCDKSSKLCSSGHFNDFHCELSSCCQEQANDTGRRQCIGNFTPSQPSSAPSEAPTGDSIHEAEASPTAASALPVTSSASVPTPFGAKSPTKVTSKMLAVTTAVIGWLLSTR